jgi:NaMN:DMB phosphoribosyltransferase/adenosyl cobinamide kinase/adenosyl cobinamide phosphate guanylyltransferase
MSFPPGRRTVLVLGGVHSGASGFAGLLAGAGARRLVPGRGEDLSRLAGVLAEAKPDETLLVDGVPGWLPAGRAAGGGTDPAGAALASLAAAVRDCPARLVLVSTELGLATPTTAAGRDQAAAVGTLNQVLAEAAGAVALVVAGQPSWLKGAGAGEPAGVSAAAPSAGDLVSADLPERPRPPAPDQEARAAAAEHLNRLGTARFGALAAVVGFAAATQGRSVPEPWQRIRVLALHGDHHGAASAGAPGSAGRVAQLRAGAGPVAQLAAPVPAAVQVVEAAAAAPIEDGPASNDEEVGPALGHGWRLAQVAADEGVDVIVLAAVGDGADTAAAATTAALLPSTEPAGLLARVRAADGTIDDEAWMRRCAAVRDAVHRARLAARTGGRAVLAELGGADIAIATGVLLGAATRRTPVLLDGPVGLAACLVARNVAPSTRYWCLLPDHGRHPTVVPAAEALGLDPVLDLRMDLGEGATALAALPLLRSALVLAGTLPAGTTAATA